MAGSQHPLSTRRKAVAWWRREAATRLPPQHRQGGAHAQIVVSNPQPLRHRVGHRAQRTLGPVYFTDAVCLIASGLCTTVLADLAKVHLRKQITRARPTSLCQAPGQWAVARRCSCKMKNLRLAPAATNNAA